MPAKNQKIKSGKFRFGKKFLTAVLAAVFVLQFFAFAYPQKVQAQQVPEMSCTDGTYGPGETVNCAIAIYGNATQTQIEPSVTYGVFWFPDIDQLPVRLGQSLNIVPDGGGGQRYALGSCLSVVQCPPPNPVVRLTGQQLIDGGQFGNYIIDRNVLTTDFNPAGTNDILAIIYPIIPAGGVFGEVLDNVRGELTRVSFGVNIALPQGESSVISVNPGNSQFARVFNLTYSVGGAIVTEDGGNTIQVTWNWGDGANTGPIDITNQNVQHTYAAAGTYNVNATFTYQGNQKTASSTVVISGNNNPASATTTPSNSDSGGPLQAILVTVVGILVGIIRSILYFLYGLIVVPFIEAASRIQVGLGSCGTPPTGFLGVVCPGWEFVRNFVNMLFILFLIVIGIATILRVQSYNYKRLLGMLIIMAVLVNFSLVISQAILRIADVMQNAFISNQSEELKALGHQLIYGGSFWGPANNVSLYNLLFGASQVDGYTVVATQIIGLAFALMAFVIMAGIALFLMIRIVALWILLILSPFAYALNILPPLKRFAGMWWSSFIKYALFTPIMFFFIRLASELSRSQNLISGALNQPSWPAGGLTTFIFTNLQHLVILGFLFAGLLVAQKMSVFGAGMITGMAKTAALIPVGVAGFGAGAAAGWVGKKYNEQTARLLEGKEGSQPGAWRKMAFAAANPLATYKGWKIRSTESKQRAQEKAVAGGREMVEQFQTGGWKGKAAIKIPYRQYAERAAENEYLKEYSAMSKEQFMRHATLLDGKKGEEYDRRRRAIVKGAAANGYLDDLLRTKHFAGKYADEDGTFYNARVLNRFMYGYMGKSEQSMRVMDEDLEELGKKTQHWEYLGHARYNPAKGTFERGMVSDGYKDVTRDIVTMDEKGNVKNVEKVTTKLEQFKDLSKKENNYQADYEFSEWRKQGGRERCGSQAHVFQSLSAERDAQGRMMFNEDGEVHNPFWGSESGKLEEDQKIMYKNMDSGVAREQQHIKLRNVQTVFGADPDKYHKDTRTIDVNEQQARQIDEAYKVNKAHTTLLAAKGLGIKNPDDVKGFKIQYKDTSGQMQTKGYGDMAAGAATARPVAPTPQPSPSGNPIVPPAPNTSTPPAGGTPSTPSPAEPAPAGGTPPPSAAPAEPSPAARQATDSIVSELKAEHHELARKVVDEISSGMSSIADAQAKMKAGGVEEGKIKQFMDKVAGSTAEAKTAADSGYVQGFAGRFPGIDPTQFKNAVRDGMTLALKANHKMESPEMTEAINQKLAEIAKQTKS